MNHDFLELASYGIEFPGAQEWITPETRSRLANDAALQTIPNTLVPVELTAYIDPEGVEILTEKHAAAQIFAEKKFGDWTTPYFRFPVEEYTGGTQPYSDDANGIVSDVNINWPIRQQYIFQATIEYGDYEQAVNSAALVDIAAKKQRAAARIIAQDANKFALLGVAGKGIYGLLNDPNLPNATSVSSWSAATSDQIYNAIVDNLYAKIAENAGGLVDQNTPFVLAVSPKVNALLVNSNTYGKSALDLLKANFADITVVSVPELGSMTNGDTAYLFARQIEGLDVGKLPFGVKFRAGRVVPKMSSFEQKFIGGTYGGLIYYPFAVARIYGMVS